MILTRAAVAFGSVDNINSRGSGVADVMKSWQARQLTAGSALKRGVAVFVCGRV